MQSNWTRRNLLRLAVAAPVGAVLGRYKALAAPHLGKVKITAIKAMALKNIAGNCLIRIDTDAGITGYGEAGSSGPMRSHPAAPIASGGKARHRLLTYPRH